MIKIRDRMNAITQRESAAIAAKVAAHWNLLAYQVAENYDRVVLLCVGQKKGSDDYYTFRASASRFCVPDVAFGAVTDSLEKAIALLPDVNDGYDLVGEVVNF